MARLRMIVTLLVIFPGLLLAQKSEPSTSIYLNQDLAGDTACVFAPGIVSLKDQYEYGSVFFKGW